LYLNTSLIERDGLYTKQPHNIDRLVYCFGQKIILRNPTSENFLRKNVSMDIPLVGFRKIIFCSKHTNELKFGIRSQQSAAKTSWKFHFIRTIRSIEKNLRKLRKKVSMNDKKVSMRLKDQATRLLSLVQLCSNVFIGSESMWIINNLIGINLFVYYMIIAAVKS
jgi:hypothetical protein